MAAHLMSRLDGERADAPDAARIAAMAEMLATIHDVRPAEPFRTYQSWACEAKRVVPAWTRDPRSWQSGSRVRQRPRVGVVADQHVEVAQGGRRLVDHTSAAVSRREIGRHLRQASTRPDVVAELAQQGPRRPRPRRGGPRRAPRGGGCRRTHRAGRVGRPPRTRSRGVGSPPSPARCVRPAAGTRGRSRRHRAPGRVPPARPFRPSGTGTCLWPRGRQLGGVWGGVIVGAVVAPGAVAGPGRWCRRRRWCRWGRGGRCSRTGWSTRTGRVR